MAVKGAKEAAAGKAPVSVIVLTKDEEANLPGCLASLGFAAEVVVVDSQSRDRTRALARQAGARVFNRPWPGFTAQRNFAVAHCTQPWVLSVDADERISGPLAREISLLLAGEPACDGYRIPEVNDFYGRWLRHGGIYPGTHLILYRRELGRYQSGGGDVHEGVQVPRQGVLKGHLIHHAYPSLELALEKLNRYTDLEAQGRVKAARGQGAYYLWVKPLRTFLDNYLRKGGFLDGPQGLLYAFQTGYYSFATAIKIWESQEKGIR